MKSNLARFLKRVQQTRDQEINCSECLDQISRYVDVELATRQAEQHMPRVSQHLEQCTVCQEEYQVLRELARFDEQDQAPGQDQLFDQLKPRP